MKNNFSTHLTDHSSHIQSAHGYVERNMEEGGGGEHLNPQLLKQITSRKRCAP